jgi:NTE family protein
VTGGVAHSLCMLGYTALLASGLSPAKHRRDRVGLVQRFPGYGLKSLMKVALLLMGGGARAAFQVGVLRALREVLGHPVSNPFPILCGTSAGAINAATLAVHARNFTAGIDDLLDVWSHFRAHQVYRVDPLGIARSGARWLSAFMFGWLVKQNPRALFDNTPLGELLRARLDLTRIQDAIASEALYALSVTAFGYESGESISFFQAAEAAQSWSRTQRAGARAQLSIEHLLASSAIPFCFPAVKIHREYFGDGSLRQVAPISPAIHLGADRVLVIGVANRGKQARQRAEGYPSPAQIGGHILSSIFLDSLEMDIERMQRVNKTVRMIPDGVLRENDVRLRSIDVMVIEPSERLDYIAAAHVHSLPRTVRTLLRGVGATNKGGSALASYLLFEPSYTHALMDLGYRDAMRSRAELAQFVAGGY